MEKPDGLSWEHIVNDKGVDMAIINRQKLVDFMLYAEYLLEENRRLTSICESTESFCREQSKIIRGLKREHRLTEGFKKLGKETI